MAVKIIAGIIVTFIAFSSISIAETRTHNNSYKNIKLGVSTFADVVKNFGAPLDKKVNSNNVIYYYTDFHVTILDKTGKVNTIIIFSDNYTDKNGVRIGLSQKDVESKLSKKVIGGTVTDLKNGISYWFSDGKVSKIVLAYQTWN